MRLFQLTVCSLGIICALPSGAQGSPFFFTTGTPDGLIGTGSRPSAAGVLEIESADDFILSSPTVINGASFFGLVPSGVTLSDVTQVRVEIYRVFPKDSTDPPSGNVPTRKNSPSDVAFAERDSALGTLSFTPAAINSNFSVANSVLNGIFPSPGEFTGGEGSVSGTEVSFNVHLTTPIVLPADHYFFVPQVALTSGDFLWLSAPKPITPPLFPGDLQSWIRNENLAPDWLRVGTDITHQGPFNAAFSLSGQTVPEPATILTFAGGILLIGIAGIRQRSIRSRAR